VIRAFYHLVTKRKEDLSICWEVTQGCNGEFLDCFIDIPNVTWVDAQTFEECNSATEKYTGLQMPGAILSARGEKEKELVKFSDVFEPTLEIKNTVQALAVNHKLGEGKGIHVRRTDLCSYVHECGKTMTADSEFFDFIESNEGNCYLATDNPDTRDIFVSKYGKLIVFNSALEPKNHPHKRCSSLKDAVIDLLVLTKCAKFMGTKHSTFSRTITTIRSENDGKTK
jgi:hypothetical protein